MPTIIDAVCGALWFDYVCHRILALISDNSFSLIESVSDMRVPLSVVAIFCCLHVAAPAHAQLPSLLPSKAIQPSNSAATKDVVQVSDPQKELADAQSRLSETQDALKRLQGQLNQAKLSAVVRQELLQQFNIRQMLVDRYSQQVDYLKQLQVLEQKIRDARQQRDDWVPPAGSPPWSVIDGDVVRNDMLVLEARIDQLGRELVSISTQLVNLGQEKTANETRLRQLQDRGTRSSDADRLQLEKMQGRLALESSVLLRTDLERRVKEKEKTLLEIRLATARKTWQYYDGRFVLSGDVLAGVKGDLQSLIDRNRESELKALAASETALARLNEAQARFVSLDQARVSAAQRAVAKANLDIAQAEELAARTEVDRLRRMIELGGYGLQLWDARAEIYANPKPNAARLEEIAQRVRTGLVRVRQARDLLRESLATREQEAFDLRETSLTATSPLDKRSIAARLKAATAQTDADRLVMVALEKFEQYLRVVYGELGVQERDRTLKEHAVAYWQYLVALADTVWRYELFTVDDVVVADGKEVKTTRSVTVGKSVGAIGILVLGFFLISRLIRASLGLAERRLGLKTSIATIIRRWLTVLATGTLIVLSFNLVQIPLSVFAFLGGALAIGVGFGTQNLLKNLISGVMLLVERPIRIGDLVEVDNVRGRVTSIGIRFSTIHSSDGIDTLIPNSELVEKKLTNWTFSNPDIRREIRVGVAYGADPVQVKNLMQSAALEHPDVMRMPEPMVVLDDLGDNALIFTLRYWIRIQNGTDGRRVDSDLRCEILEKLNNAGIDVPYPQRDIRLTAMSALPVTVVEGPPELP